MQHNRKKYKTLLVDPPWDIQQRGNFGAIHKYDLMTLDRIKAMPIKDLMEDDAHCWLWVSISARRSQRGRTCSLSFYRTNWKL